MSKFPERPSDPRNNKDTPSATLSGRHRRHRKSSSLRHQRMNLEASPVDSLPPRLPSPEGLMRRSRPPTPDNDHRETITTPLSEPTFISTPTDIAPDAPLHSKSRRNERNNHALENERGVASNDLPPRRKKTLVSKLKWLRNEIRKQELMKAYFAVLSSFPKTIFLCIFTTCLLIGGIGHYKRQYIRDMHKLYAMKHSTEINAYHRSFELWDDSTTEFFVIAEPRNDPKRDIWTLEDLHFSGWLDSAIRHLSLNNHGLLEMADSGDFERRRQGQHIVNRYLQSVPPYSRNKLVCECPSCTQATCISIESGAITVPAEVQLSSRLTHVISTPVDVPENVRSRFADLCVQNQILTAGALLAGMDPSYGCVALSPFSLIPEMKNAVVPGKRGIFSDAERLTTENSPIHDSRLVLGDAFDYEENLPPTKASALGFFYKLKSPNDEIEKARNLSFQTVLELLALNLHDHFEDPKIAELYTITARTSRSLQDALDASTALDIEMKIRLAVATVAVSTVMFWGLGLKKTVMRFYRSKIRQIVTPQSDLNPDSFFYIFRFTMTSMGVIVISGFGASGLLYLSGLPHVPASESIPFMVLGIGVDDFFVIWNAYMQTYRGVKMYTPHGRILRAYQNTLNSITLSTMTTVISFLIGSFSPFWHIQIYSINVAVCLLFLYLACWTMLPIVMLGHAKRHQSDGLDIIVNQDLYDLPSNEQSSQKDKKGRDPRDLCHLEFADREVILRSQLYWRGPFVNHRGEIESNKEIDELVASKAVSMGDTSDPSPERNRLLMFHRFALFILVPNVKAIIVTIFAITTLISVLVITFRMRFGLSLEDATPFSSTLRHYLEAQADHFSNYGDEFDISFRLPTILINDAPQDTFRLIDAWGSALCDPNSPYTDLYPEELQLSVGYCLNPVMDAVSANADFDDPYSPSLTSEVVYDTFERISHDYHPMNSLIYTRGMAMINLFHEDFDQDYAKEVIFFRMHVVVPVMSDTAASWSWYSMLKKRADILSNALNDVMDASVQQPDDRWIRPEIVISSKLLPMWAADAHIHVITITSLLTALICVTACSFFLLGRSPVQTILILYTMLLIDIHLIGIMVLTGSTLNILTMITLLMAQGFSVDYLAHMSHAFAHSRLKNTTLRVQAAIVSIGQSITQATATTFIALFCLVLSDKYTLRVFCRMVIATIGCAFIFSMLYFPVLLSFVDPKHLPTERQTRKERCDEYHIDSDLELEERDLIPVGGQNRVALQHDTEKYRPASAMLFQSASPPMPAVDIEYPR